MNKKRTESTETLKKVLRFIGRYRILLVVSIVLAAASVLLQLYVPILFGNAIDCRTEGEFFSDVALASPGTPGCIIFRRSLLDHESYQ